MGERAQHPGGGRSRRRLAWAVGGVALVLVVLGWLLGKEGSLVRLKGTFSHPFDRRSDLDERAVASLFDLDRIGGAFRYDPLAYLRPLPDREEAWEWPEHPDGGFVLRTNELGLYEDHPTPSEGTGPRVLVAGDSHTAGLVGPRESFANLAEALLRREPGLEDLEVLNAGTAYTGPYCYAGTLRAFLDLEPDVFVAVLFTGNDFADDLKVRYLLDGWSLPRGDDAYARRIAAAGERWSGPVSQGFNQAFRFRHFPGEADRALEQVVDSYRAMRDLCSEHGIAFLAVVLPTKMDVDVGDDLGTRAALREALELTPEDVAVSRRLAAGFVEEMADAGVDCLDPTARMREAPEVLYWRRDYHLGVAGHALLAELLAPELERLLGRDPR